jgi:hypothetical protein
MEIMDWKEVHKDNVGTSMIRFGLPKHLGYLLYCFRQDYQLDEKEMIKLLEITTNAHWFKKEYGLLEDEK